MRRRRRAVAARAARRAARRLAAHLGRHRLFLRARRVAAYLPQDGELDPTPLMRRAWAAGKAVYLPVLHVPCHHRLMFAPYREGDRLVPNAFGIPEPDLAVRHLVHPWELDLVLTPLVAFDARGHRLGMGGGFYDRSFAFLRRRRHWRRPRLVGLAYAFQEVAHLPAAPWDVPLAAVATEAGLRLVRRG